MNAQKVEKKPKRQKRVKENLRDKYDTLPWKERMKAKYLNFYFLQRVVIWIFRLVLMVGISYIVIFPFLTKIVGSIMAPEDFLDVTVRLIPKHVSFDIYRGIITELNYFTCFGNTFMISFMCAILQTLTCCWIGYGFAKFKFRGRNLIFLLVMLTMIIPHHTLQSAMTLQFRNFDVFGILRFLNGGGIEFFGWNVMDINEDVAAFFQGIDILPDEIPLWYQIDEEPAVFKLKITGIDISRSYLPLVLLSVGGLAFKNGLYIFLLRQFFRGIPDELEESAYIDGCGTFHTFFRIILPLSIPMMITVFLFSFCWQWTDTFYLGILNMGNIGSRMFLVDLVGRVPESLIEAGGKAQTVYDLAIQNTCGLLIILPLVILYAFCQRYLVQGIEHSGIAN